MTQLDALFDHALLLDLETDRDGARLHKIGAVFRDREFRRQGRFRLDKALGELQAFARGAEVVIGHNLLGHDIPVLKLLSPALRLLALSVVDTLFISPLAFPANPYHRLVKDYKLVHDGISDPVADCHLAARVLREQAEVLAEADPELLRLYRFCFRGALLLDGHAAGGSGIAELFRQLGAELPEVPAVRAALMRRWEGKVCISTAPRLILDHLVDPNLRPVLAYATAWLGVAGTASVLPPWVRHRFPATVPLLKALRERPCDNPQCAWCRAVHDPERQLRRWFGFDAFRPEPAAPDGTSLQRAIVAGGLAERPQLAILPTGGGKSLCFQLPALVRNLRRGTLTVVVSPLQALMKDQVDNLAHKTGTTAAAAIYGMLTPPERGEVFERVRLGDIALLYVSPEQLRNRSVADLLAAREIGCWVFDEAHCLSKWGHDFRPDYLYAGRFIRDLARRQGVEPPPVACFTATAKPDVIAEIIDFFERNLGQRLIRHQGGVERANLRFEVQLVGKHDKQARLNEVLKTYLADGGGAVVYAGARHRTEELAEALAREDWAVAPFHAGLPAPEKRRVQDAFVAGDLQVICATNAFGMGVDKDDVRLVVHVDIPGSLENYVQEAGRAGRDRAEAACVLLYDPGDIESQFSLTKHSELSKRDIAEILRGLRRLRKRGQDTVVATSGELLRDEELRLGFDSEGRDSDTRVRIAVAWLERAGLVQREQNAARVFQGRPLAPTLDEAKRKIDKLGLSKDQAERWLAVYEAILNSDPDEGLSADELARLAAFERPQDRKLPPWDRGDTPGQRVLRTLHDMAKAGLLKKGPQLTAFIRYKVKNPSTSILERVVALERALVQIMREQAPDLEAGGDWAALSLQRLNQRLLDDGYKTSNPEILRDLLKGLSLDGKGMAGAGGSLVLRPDGRDSYRVKLLRDWPVLGETVERRHRVAAVVLQALLAKVSEDAPKSAELLVAFGTDELVRALDEDLSTAGQLRDPLAAVERALLYLHEQRAITLHQGLAVFRSAMTIRLPPEAKGKRYSESQYQPLKKHYGERTFQIHVMDEYARRGAAKIAEALALVADYFASDKTAFVKRWFAGRARMLERATTAESFRRVVESLDNPDQVELVAAPEDGNRLVLAGPGSGKTRVIVHRCAYLLRVRRVPAHRILVLCFNRCAALELRRRLADLAGDCARGVTVQTYHGFAMRLGGHSFAERVQAGGDEALDFDGLIREAAGLLSGEADLPGLDGDGLRERLLAGFRHILVDEYQDIDADQYALVSAIAGRTRTDADEKLTLLAVGDDDQNIYAFRNTSVAFIQRFQQDFDAQLHYLVENYRSSRHIIDAANALIAHNSSRMKAEQPVRIDRHRAERAPGGRWEALDPVATGRVLLLDVADAPRQAVAMVERIREFKRLGDHSWSDFAVLARTHEVLRPIRALFEHEQIPLAMQLDVPLHRVREVRLFLGALRTRGSTTLEPDALNELVPAGDGPWIDLIRDLIDDWRAEAQGAAVAASRIAEFCYETLAALRRDRLVGDGVLLSTLHGAKGLEFPHVLIADGGWSRNPAETEDERRLFYVGMTRARETLTILDHSGGHHPHRGLIEGDWAVAVRPDFEAPDLAVIARRFDPLSPCDLDIGFAGRQPESAPIHANLAAAATGDPLTLIRSGDQVLLQDQQSRTLARLSRAGLKTWGERLDKIEAIHLIALLERRRDQEQPGFAERCRSERWEWPMVEICWRAKGA